MRNLYLYIASLSFSVFTFQLNGQNVCDVEVSGILAYCNSFKGTPNNTIDGYFIGFRIKSENGDTLDVVDLAGNVPTNLGKRINDINVEFEPPDTSRAPVRIAGGADSLEFWYFGPFMDGDSFNIVLVDRSGHCDTVEVASGTFSCQGKDPNACDNPVPLYFLDFSLSEWDIGGGGGGNENVDQIFLIMQRSRVATCCQTGGQRCFEFLITLDEDDIGLLVDDVGNGSPGGKIYADSLNGFACGSSEANTWPFVQDNGNSGDDPICLSGSAREWIVLSCKQGNNVTGVSFGTVGELNVFPELTYADCEAHLEVLNANSAMWSSNDDPGLDNLISLGTNNINATFLYNEEVFGEITSCDGDTFIYFIAGFPDNTCIPEDSLLHDTTYVVVYPPFFVSIDSTCIASGDSVLLVANITSPVDCNYKILWSTGDTTSSIIVPNETATYQVSVTRPDLDSLVRDCIMAVDVVDIKPPSIECTLTDLQFECQGPIPSPDFSSISLSGCGIDPLIYIKEVSNNGAGCPADPLIISRFYIVDFDGDTISTPLDKDSCMQIFTFIDQAPPSFTCPPNVTIGCFDSTAPAMVTAIDNCDPEPDVSYNDVIINGPCIYTYRINRLWTALDDCGNLTECTQTIQVRDILAPQLTCPPDLTILHAESTLPQNTGIATAIDNCDPSPFVNFSDSVSPLCSDVNTITRTWTAVDVCGNSSQCTQRITIEDRGQVCGQVYNETMEPMEGITIQVIRDLNSNENFDPGEPVISTTLTDVSGNFCFQSLAPCAYILRQVLPGGYSPFADYDTTPDPDGDDSIDGPDNEIPVTLQPAESDVDNIFVNIRCPSQLPVLPPDTICNGGQVVFQIAVVDPEFSYSWNFGSGSDPSSGLGAGPHEISYNLSLEDTVVHIPVQITLSKEGCPDLTGTITTVVINTYPDASIEASTGPLCYFAERNFKPSAPENPGAIYQWSFGIDAVPSSATGYGPHAVYYNTSGSKTVKLIVDPDDPGAACIDSSTITFMVLNCPSNITGRVNRLEGPGIQGVNLRLFADADTNGLPDNATIIRNVFTNSTGIYSMASITPGDYVIMQVQPPTWGSIDDYDSSEDFDVVDNLDSLDNLIPVSLNPSEIDSNNVFVEVANPGDISGSVFRDPNNNQSPDSGEGIAGVVIKLFTDTNKDGAADGSIPIDTAMTGQTGFYQFNTLSAGNYVLVQEQPSAHISVKDFDASNDQDSVPNTNMINDTLPVTLLNEEHDQNNYFIEDLSCPLIVTNVNDDGSGSLRYMISCAAPGDTIRFHQNLAGETIFLTSEAISINKHTILLSGIVPRIRIKSDVPGLFDISQGIQFEISHLELVGGLSGLPGSALNNMGVIRLHDVTIHRNELFPESGILIYNHPGSQLFLTDINKLMMHYD